MCVDETMNAPIAMVSTPVRTISRLALRITLLFPTKDNVCVQYEEIYSGLKPC